MFSGTRKLLLILLVTLLASSGLLGGTVSYAEEISKLVLNKNELTMEVGGTASLTATAVYVSNNTESVTIKTDWNSGDPDIATVYAGSVTAKKEGKAVITATYMGKTVIVNVTVTKKVRSLIKDKQKIDLRKGQDEQIKLTAYYDDGTSEEVTSKAEWNIDNGQVATVVNGLVTAQGAGTAIITAKYIGQSVSIPVSIEIVKRVDPSLSRVSLLLNGTETIKLEATYPDGTKEDVTDQAEWESADPSIADVLKGTVTGYGPGQTEIVATYGTKSTTINVEVDRAIKLGLDKSSLLLDKDATYQAKLTATYSNDSTEDITERAVWTSSNKEVASVVNGRIVAHAIGEAIITANYGDKSASLQVDVEVPRRLELNKEVVYLQTEQSEQLTLTATYADGTSKNVTAFGVWSVDKEQIAYVAKGKVTTYRAGEATVTAEYGGKTVTAKIAVDIPISLIASKKAVSFQNGGSEQITLKAIYSDGRETDITDKAEWASSSTSVAEVSKGLITGVGTGAVTVTAKYGTRQTTVQVSVGVLKSLTSTAESNLSLKKGAKQTLEVTAAYVDTTKTVTNEATWTSSDPKVVKVDAGVVTAVASGKANVTAEFDGKTLTFEIRVDLADKLTATPSYVSIDLGERKQLKLEAKDGAGQTIDVTGDAEWASNNLQVAEVSGGLVIPVARGKVNVTAKYGGQTVTIPVEIGVVDVLEINKKYAVMRTGQTLQLELLATLTDGSKKDLASSAQWKSSAYKIADVSNGMITAVSSGKATITATFGGKTVSIPVEIDVLKYLKTDVVTLTMETGKTAEVKATATFSDQTEADVSIDGLWSTSNIRVVDVKDGILKATGKGTATVTISYAGKKTSVYVTVK
jgi:urease gamma subunit